MYFFYYFVIFLVFDEFFDLCIIFCLFGYSNLKFIFFLLDLMFFIYIVVDVVRDNVRNKWVYVNFNDWIEVFFKDCFVKFEDLVKSVGIGVKE